MLVNGSWSFWGTWGDCTAMCDTGTTTRTRECASPKPTNGGKECDGESTVTVNCNKWVCPRKYVMKVFRQPLHDW